MKKREIDILNGSLGRKILQYALPLAFTGILQQFFNAADIAVVGQFVGKDAMAAVGCNSPVVSLLLSLFVGIGLGINVVVAKYTGQKNPTGIHRAVHTSVVLALICGFGVLLLGEIIASPLLRLLSVPDEIFNMSVQYLRIYLLSLPFAMLYNFLAAVFQSQGDTKTPLICLAISGVANIVLNVFFVCGLGLSVVGVSLATVISNVIGATFLFVLLRRSRAYIRIRPSALCVHSKILREVLRIGLPAGIQGMVFALSNLCIQSAINSLGSVVIAASAAAFNIEIFAYFILNSFGQACTTFVGQNYGAKNHARCRKTIKIAFVQNMIFTVVLSSIILLFGVPLLNLFNGDPLVAEYGMIRLKYILLFEFVNVFIEIYSGALRGYGHSMEPALLALIGICGIRVGWVYTIFQDLPSFKTLMIAYPISWSVTAVAICIAYYVLRKKIENKSRV